MTIPTSCTVQLNDDAELCGRAVQPGSPLPVCPSCTGKMWAFLREASGLTFPLSTPDPAATRSREDLTNVVYYVELGDQIKIGTTSGLRRRLTNFPPDAQLLATEPGGYLLERERHQQFEHLRVIPRNGGQTEWFFDAPELREHIATLAGFVPSAPG